MTSCSDFFLKATSHRPTAISATSPVARNPAHGRGAGHRVTLAPKPFRRRLCSASQPTSSSMRGHSLPSENQSLPAQWLPLIFTAKPSGKRGLPEHFVAGQRGFRAQHSAAPLKHLKAFVLRFTELVSAEYRDLVEAGCTHAPSMPKDRLGFSTRRSGSAAGIVIRRGGRAPRQTYLLMAFETISCASAWIRLR